MESDSPPHTHTLPVCGAHEGNAGLLMQLPLAAPIQRTVWSWGLAVTLSMLRSLYTLRRLQCWQKLDYYFPWIVILQKLSIHKLNLSWCSWWAWLVKDLNYVDGRLACPWGSVRLVSVVHVYLDKLRWSKWSGIVLFWHIITSGTTFSICHLKLGNSSVRITQGGCTWHLKDTTD